MLGQGERNDAKLEESFEAEFEDTWTLPPSFKEERRMVGMIT